MFKPRFAIALLLVALLSSGMAKAEPAPKPERLLSQHFIGADKKRPKPTLSFQDGDGHHLTLRDYKGRYVLLNIWATWCGPCVKEMPSLNALQAHLGMRNISLIALAEDRQGAPAVSGFYQRHELKNLKVYVDTEGTALSLLNLRGVPTTLLIAPDGHEVGRVEDALDWMNPENLAYIDQLIGAKKP